MNQIKAERVKRALSHREGDRVPAGDSFWTGFIKRCNVKWGADFDPYRFFDLDYVTINPNMDPHIRAFDVLEENGEDITVKTGFEAVIKRSGDIPMPSFINFSITSPDEMASFEFDDPSDPRRFFQGGDDQLNCVGDALLRNIPSWDERVDAYAKDIPVFGSVCEPYEYLWRIIGTENALCWMIEEPELYTAFVDRIGDFNLKLLKAQIEAGRGRLSGMYIWGDVAYKNGMLFSPDAWRRIFMPYVKSLVDVCHSYSLPVIYHGCGNATKIFNDIADIGIDAYNPLEAKAGLDVVKLKAQYGDRLAYAGNINVQILEKGQPDEIRREVLYKLQAGRGGGWIFQSDHSVSSGVAPESYQLALDTLRQYGSYPLDMERIEKELGVLNAKLAD